LHDAAEQAAGLDGARSLAVLGSVHRESTASRWAALERSARGVTDAAIQ
jgi:hypothetical protein